MVKVLSSSVGADPMMNVAIAKGGDECSLCSKSLAYMPEPN